MMRSRGTVDPEWMRGPSDVRAVELGCYFDAAAGRFACDFLETFCRQSKGKWADAPLALLPWQRDFVMRLFGWRRPDGSRRYRRFYLEVAKKNGKSTLLSGLALLMLVADGEGAPEVYLNAVDRTQAGIIFDESARMVRSSPELAGRLDVIESKSRIIFKANNGVIRANSADAPSKDGLNPSATFFDELHRQKNSTLWDIFAYAGASREQPLLGSITTAGEDESGPWHEQREYSEGVNAGTRDDITHLGVVYRADPKDDLDAEATWRKANPSLGITINLDDFAREYAEAKATPSKWGNFLRLRLNIVQAAATKFIDVEMWKAAPPPLSLMRKGPTFAGLDLSSTTDISALVWATGSTTGGFDLGCMFWLPADNIARLEREHQRPYRTWAERGLLTLTPGNVIDYEFIRAELLALAKVVELAKVMVDPWNALQLATQLQGDGLPVEFIRQGYASLSAPTKELERLYLSGRIRHGDNPILSWHASNCVADKDPAGNVKLSKQRGRSKIDGMAALVNALAGAMAPEDPDAGPSIYETQGF